MKLEFDEIYKRFFKDVYLFVLSMSKEPHTAEEITQDTFFKALKEIRHFQGNCSVKSWLCQIAKNSYYSYLWKKTVDIAEIAEFSGELADEFDLVQFIHPPSGTAQSQALRDN